MPYLWIWLLIAPPLLALIDAMSGSGTTQFGRRDHALPRGDRDLPRGDRDPDGLTGRPAPVI